MVDRRAVLGVAATGLASLAGCTASDSAGTTTTTFQATKMVVTELRLVEETATAGRTVVAEMTVRNVGSLRGTGSVSVFVDGEHRSDVGIPLLYPGQGLTQELAFEAPGPGEHQLRVENETLSFDVVDG